MKPKRTDFCRQIISHLHSGNLPQASRLGKLAKKPFSILSSLTLLLLTLSAGGCVIVLDKQQEFPFTQNPIISPPQPQPIVLNPTEIERSVYEQVNKYRASQNLPPLKLDSAIIQVARAHSQAMANGSASFSHDGFETRIDKIAESVDYGSAGENLAYNFGYQDPGKQAVEGWIKSPGHQKNMVGNFDLTGIGIARNAKGEYYFTQIFIKRR